MVEGRITDEMCRSCHGKISGSDPIVCIAGCGGTCGQTIQFPGGFSHGNATTIAVSIQSTTSKGFKIQTLKKLEKAL